MNRILEGIDWPTFLAYLQRRAGPSFAEAVARSTGEDVHAAFALLVHERAWDQNGLTGALIAAQTTGERLDACRVAAWLPGAASTYLRLRDSVNGTEDPAPAVVLPAVTGDPLDLADAVAALDLPLLALAEDIGRRHALGRLVVADGAAGALCGGWYDHRAGTVVLDLDALGDQVADAWAHELAHACDPAITAGDIGAQEAWADQLGPLLLEHDPATVVAARALMPAPPRARPPDLPAPGVDTFLAFAGLPLAPSPARMTA